MKPKRNRSKELEALNSEEANALNTQLENYLDLEVLASSGGGKLLIKSARQDAVSAIDKLANGYITMTHAELVTNCASLKANLVLLRTLTRAKTNKELTEKELDEMLADTLDE